MELTTTRTRATSLDIRDYFGGWRGADLGGGRGRDDDFFRRVEEEGSDAAGLGGCCASGGGASCAFEGPVRAWVGGGGYAVRYWFGHGEVGV